MKRLGCVLVLVCVALAASAASAFAQYTINVSMGRVFTPSTGRAPSDILLIEHNDLLFDFGDFNGGRIGAELVKPIDNFFEVAVSAGISRKSVPTNNRFLDPQGIPIRKDLGLNQWPFAATFRMLPLRQSYAVQPYVGGGLTVLRYRFIESGDFRLPTGRIFRGEHYQATRNAIGPVLVFGMRVAGDRLVFGFETRYQKARGSFGPAFAHVQNADIDLDGWVVQGTAGIRFGLQNLRGPANLP